VLVWVSSVFFIGGRGEGTIILVVGGFVCGFGGAWMSNGGGRARENQEEDREKGEEGFHFF